MAVRRPTSSSGRQPPIVPSQPYLEWARATDFTYLRTGTWLPLLVEFDPKALPLEHGKTPLQVFASRTWLNHDPAALDNEFIVPESFVQLPPVLAKSTALTFCVVLVKLDATVVQSLVTSKEWQRTIISAHVGPPVDLQALSPKSAPGADTDGPSLSDSVVAPSAPVQPSSVTSEPGTAAPTLSIDRVVIAVIDQGIAFANSRFENVPGNTRIEYLWQQDFLGSVIPPFSAPLTNAPGCELTRLSINSALASARSIGATDDWTYRKVGGLDFSIDGYKPLGHRGGHGTHVLDLAAADTDPTQHPIIAVDMPEDAVGDPAGSTLDVHAAWGLIYVLSRAWLLRDKTETLPVVVNLSNGPHEGPHDGTGELERFMDQLIQSCHGSPTPLAIVLAAGNFRQSRVHARGGATTGQPLTFQWRVQPGGLTPSMMEIWLPKDVGPGVTVTLRPPNGTPIKISSTMPTAQVTATSAPAPLYWAQYVGQKSVPGSLGPLTSRAHVVLGIARTSVDPSGTWGQAVAPFGSWSVEIKSRKAIQVEAWIKRSDTLSGRRAKGRQSYFDDPKYAKYMANGRAWDYDGNTASYQSRIQTQSGIATGVGTFVIGGYTVSERFPSMYSSHGWRSIGALRYGPSWHEAADDSAVCKGVLAAGTMSGSMLTMRGTSVAAPQATRRIAERWVADQLMPSFPPGAFVPLPPTRKERPIPTMELEIAFGGGLVPRLPRKVVSRL